MAEEQFTPDTLAEIASKVDEALSEISAKAPSWRTRGRKTPDPALRKHKLAINHVAGESSDTFLMRFRQAAWKDLCQQGGHLHGLRQRWLDPTKPEVIRSIGALLAGMGVSGNLIPALIVPLLVIILHLGVTAFCDMPLNRSRAGH
jgi:hypothetical protein